MADESEADRYVSGLQGYANIFKVVVHAEIGSCESKCDTQLANERCSMMEATMHLELRKFFSNTSLMERIARL